MIKEIQRDLKIVSVSPKRESFGICELEIERAAGTNRKLWNHNRKFPQTLLQVRRRSRREISKGNSRHEQDCQHHVTDATTRLSEWLGLGRLTNVSVALWRNCKIDTLLVGMENGTTLENTGAAS